MAELLMAKPSRIHNLSYIFLGYYLSFYFAYDLNLPIEQKILLTTFLGGFIGTLVYYIKPIERVMSLYFRLSKKNVTHPSEIFNEWKSPVYKTEILFSKYLDDDRTIINGAFFLAIGVFTSNKLLGTIIELSQVYLVFQIIIGIALICAGTWNIYVLVTEKLPILIFFYNNIGISKYSQQLEREIQLKDWIKAKKIIDQEPELVDWETYTSVMYRGHQNPERGVCITCNKIRDTLFCIECGHEVIKECPTCKSVLVNKQDKICPKYCHKCGSKIE